MYPRQIFFSFTGLWEITMVASYLLGSISSRWYWTAFMRANALSLNSYFTNTNSLNFVLARFLTLYILQSAPVISAYIYKRKSCPYNVDEIDTRYHGDQLWTLIVNSIMQKVKLFSLTFERKRNPSWSNRHHLHVCTVL